MNLLDQRHEQNVSDTMQRLVNAGESVTVVVYYRDYMMLSIALYEPEAAGFRNILRRRRIRKHLMDMQRSTTHTRMRIALAHLDIEDACKLILRRDS